ncbi:S24 family peptidase [Maridesulfovibrio ferrireducens]|uniref:Phage repressor protein C, contains Cro/C1-type HTH and peptisase s24 domains n=1 Tax=Maridesulfovibrio ferrireducens TaxID=246191 RepID=A0A1G9BTJ5_9BACT|nr:S24 family peptidase [Maridesulfovibrio ferrireducens]MBI9111981.1 helix-turn-helix domain-containing protein [Maridesulfovibrio ferrireducens]SDK42630.1 Phage repressor protein C, contains Cro/C1-type HTH and peptisase s24 domains [Maridesulfovibrio ferrireducens]
MSKWFDETLERIKKATGTRTQVQLAEILNIRQSSISDAKRRSSIPAEWYIKLYKTHGLNPEWLSDGVEPVYMKPGKGKISADNILSETTAQYGQVPSRGRVVPVSSMAGEESGSEQWAPQQVGELNIPETFYRPSMVVLKVEGSSMEPAIRRNAFAGVDETQKRLMAGDIYAVHVPYQGVVIRRVFFDPENSRFILRPEDPQHPELYIAVQDQNKLVVGRVVWVMQEV